MLSKRRLHIGASKVHKWLSLIIGAQLLIWFASGALMSFIPIDKVRGEHLVDRAAFVPVPDDTDMLAPGTLVARAGAPVETVTWRMLGDRPVAEVKTAKGLLLFDAVTGQQREPIDAQTATQIAQKAWRAAEKPTSQATLVTAESAEYRGAQLPAWRIAFADPDQTSVLVTASTGRIAAVRTETWRLYDFFWGLHIMDWKNHEDFNSWWLLAFAIGGLALGIAGTVLLFMRWPLRPRRRVRST
jgi:hypothetical protein